MNKRFYLIILLLACRCTLSNAQTNVSGFISTNTTWNLAGSPYIVVGNTLVSYGYTLTIDPGVVIKFNTDKALQIDGELIAIGTQQNRITFTSNQAIPAAGDWAKIQFPDTCTDASLDTAGNYLSGSIMKYCDVLYGGSLGFGEIQIQSSSPYFTHCNISNSLADGIHCVGSTCLVDSSTLKYCAGYGLYFNDFFLHSNSLLIQDDSLLNNTSGGIYLGDEAPGIVVHPIEIRRNVFISNSQDGAIYNGSNYLVGERISENYFFNNSCQNGAGIVTISAKNYSVECNHFLSNQVANQGALYVKDFFSSASYIINNIFDGNVSINAGVSALSISANNSQNIYFINNLIENNVTTNNGTCNFSGQAVANSTGQFYISNNDIKNNSATKTISLNGGNQNNNTLRFAYIKNNNLVNPGVQYEIENNLPYGDPNIYADSNYWGSTNTQHIDSVIYDYFDFANQTVVYYLPILTSPILTDTTCPVIFPTGLNNIELSLSPLMLFPNPATTHFTITFNKIIEEGKIKIYNLLGDEVLLENIHHDFKKEINLQSIANGIYFVKVFDGDKSYCKKLIIEHD